MPTPSVALPRRVRPGSVGVQAGREARRCGPGGRRRIAGASRASGGQRKWRREAREWVRLPRWVRGVEDASEFEAGDGGDLVVVAAGEAVGGGAAEEGADKAAAGWDAMGELLVGEGAGEEKASGR